jgi:hypothetical protein
MLALLLGGAALVARWRFPLAALAGHPLQAWAAAGALFCVAARVFLMAWQARRGALPWTRLLLPAVLLLEGAGLSGLHGTSAAGRVRVVTALMLEIALVTFAVLRLRHLDPDSAEFPEDRLAGALEAFLPPRAAKLVATECVVLGMGLRFALGGWRQVPPAGFSYSREAVLGALLPALPLLLLGDLTLLEVLLRHMAAGWRVLIHLLDLYGILWILGLWSAMRLRPHQIRDGVLHANHGFLRRAAIPLASIESVEAVPLLLEGPEKAAYRRDAHVLAAAGPPQLRLTLKSPLPALGLFGGRRPKGRVILAVDDPLALRAALAV